MVRDIRENYAYVWWFKYLGYCAKCFPGKYCFSECYFFILQCFWHLKKQYFCLLTLLFSGFLLLGDGAEAVAGGPSSSSAPAFALLLFSVLPLANLELALISTWVFIHFPLKILRLQCTYAIGCMGQAFSSWSLNSPRVLCPISRIEVMLVKAFTFTSGFTCYSSIGMFGLTGSLESDLPTEPEWMDCPLCSFWAWGGSPCPRKNSFNFQNCEQKIISDHVKMS